MSDLPQNTILLTLAGSRAYGIHTDSSDVDLRGVMIPSLRDLICGNAPEQVDFKGSTGGFTLPAHLQGVAARNGVEGVVYDFRKVINLLRDANPNMLDLLFTREEDLIVCTSEGRILRENRDAFLSKKALNSFLGYATSQFKRMETHRRYLRGDIPQTPPDPKDFGLFFDQYTREEVLAANSLVTKQLDRWLPTLDWLTDEGQRLALRLDMEKYLTTLSLAARERERAAASYIGFDSNLMQVVYRYREYDSARREYEGYQAWIRQRNAARAALESVVGYDAKHGAHCYRLLQCCRSILTEGTLTVWNPDPIVVRIRSGFVPYEELNELVSELRSEIIQLALHSTLRNEVRKDFLDNLIIMLLSSKRMIPPHML